jgi:hypothetical protein
MKRNMHSFSTELNDKHDSHEKGTKAMTDDVREKLQVKAE